MSVVLAAVVIGVSVLTVVVVLALFVWGAVKDGEDEAASQARMAGSRPARTARAGESRVGPAGRRRGPRSGARRARR